MPEGLTFLATFVVGSAAYFGHVVLRATKVSEHRQAWINDQRDDLAIVASRAKTIVQQRSKVAPEVMTEFEEALTRVTLRENPDKREWDYVIQRLHRLRLEVRKPYPSLEEVCGHIGFATGAAQALLKVEWDRVRDGEPTYRHHKVWFWRLAAFAILVAIAIEFL